MAGRGGHCAFVTTAVSHLRLLLPGLPWYHLPGVSLGGDPCNIVGWITKRRSREIHTPGPSRSKHNKIHTACFERERLGVGQKVQEPNTDTFAGKGIETMTRKKYVS